MKTRKKNLLLIYVLFLISCSKEENNSCHVDIQLDLPKGNITLPYENIAVNLTNKESGTSYKAICDSTGKASFDIECGHYTASVHYQANSGLIFSGRIESLLLMPKSQNKLFKLELTRSSSNALVIKEIYYTGCKGKNNVDYQADQYVTLYNNSNETIYLDGVCVAVVAPAYSMESAWISYTNMTRIPVSDLTWQFPGSGKDYPLHPGEETTIATNAINHTGGEYQHANSVDLSTVDWGFWDASLKRQNIAPGVKPMKLLANLNPYLNQFAFPVIGPTIMVFDIVGTNAEVYVNDSRNRELEPQSPIKDQYYLMVPKEWVIDCVECAENAEYTKFKRVPSELDNGAVFIPEGYYSGQAVIRKNAGTASGHAIYQDTNNSADDLIVSTPSLKK